MSVTEYVSRQGSYAIAFVNLPSRLRRTLRRRCKKALLVVTTGPIDPGAGVDALVAQAIYCGVVERFNLDDSIEGGSIVRWMGDEQGKGAGYITEPYTDDLDLEGWVTAVIGSPSLLPFPIRLGGAQTGGGTKELTVGPCTRRAALDIVCTAFGVEWKITADGFVWVGDVSSYLYWQAPPVLFTSDCSGHALTLQAFKVRAQSAALDGLSAANHGLSSYTVGGVTAPVGVTVAGAQDYDDPKGDPITLTLPIDKPTEVGENLPDTEDYAESVLAQHGLWDREVALEVDGDDVPDRLMLGCEAFVSIPELEIENLDNQVAYLGQIQHPERVRIVGWTWPVTAGRGVAVVTSDGDGSEGRIIDLTPYVAVEAGAVKVEFGVAGQRVVGETKLRGVA